MSELQEYDIDRQEFIDRYLNTIIAYRKKYLMLEASKSNATASEVEYFASQQIGITEDLIKFIYHPKVYMSFDDRKAIEEKV